MKCLEFKQQNLVTLWADLVAEELVRMGVKLVCIAPGSRSTPLVAACAARDELDKVVCQDERSAAFFALGYGRAKKTPAAVITTSGSALANLFPAIVEASNDRVPLLLLTADRPPELRAVGSNQTIDQVKIFGGYPRFFVDIPVPDPKVPLRFMLSSLDKAVLRSTHPHPGPVHLNFMFREPFEPDAAEPWDCALASPLAQWAQSKAPLTQHFVSSRAVDETVVPQVAALMKRAEAGVIVAGAIGDAEAEAALLKLSEQCGWPILPDVLSNLRFRSSPMIAHYADLALVGAMPCSDVIIQVGGRLVSKRLQHYLDNNASRAHVFIDSHSDQLDPGCTVTHRIECDVARLLHDLALVIPCLTRDPSNLWLASSDRIEQSLRDMSKANSLTEIHVARSLLSSLDASTVLFSSVSMPIRDLNMFGQAHPNPPRLYANRGASGIDGIISTACGVSRALGKRSVLFCGDLTFMHDTNGLSLLKSLENPMVIVVVNNRGGGIIAMLGIYRQREILTPYFDAEHDVNLGALCAAHQINHLRVNDVNEWSQALRQIPAVSGHLVIEVMSDKERNRIDHERVREAVSARLSL